MDFIFLPSVLRQRFESEFKDVKPTVVLRCGDNMCGGAGEGYVIGDDRRFFIFSRTIGESEYRMTTGNYDDDANSINLTEDKYLLTMTIQAGAHSFNSKFSNLDRKDVELLMTQWRTATPNRSASPVAVATGDVSPIPPMVALVAAMIFVACEDGEVNPAEDALIRRVCHDDAAILQPAFDFYQNGDFNAYLRAAAGLNGRQARCALANMIELSMSDGVVGSSEQQLLARFCEEFGITGDEADRMFEILRLKNEVSIMNNSGM